MYAIRSYYATVGLDPKSRRDLMIAIRADVSARGSSVLWATHLVEEAELADRVLVLHRGRLLALGPTAEVLDGADLERLFDPHSGEAREDAP